MNDKIYFNPQFGEPTQMLKDIVNEVVERSGIRILACQNKVIEIGGLFGIFANGIYCREQTNRSTGQHMPESIALNMMYNDSYILSVLFHELGHATGTPSRLNRLELTTMPSERTPLQQNSEETTAELTARKVMIALGLFTPEVEIKNISYLMQHSFGMDEFTLARCEKNSDDAANYILANWIPNFSQSRKAA